MSGSGGLSILLSHLFVFASVRPTVSLLHILIAMCNDASPSRFIYDDVNISIERKKKKKKCEWVRKR